MNDYFNYVIGELHQEDIVVLNSLYCSEAFNHFVAMDRNDLLKDINITDSILRRSLTRLEAAGLLKLSSWNRKNIYYLTQYGITAIQKITEGVEA